MIGRRQRLRRSGWALETAAVIVGRPSLVRIAVWLIVQHLAPAQRVRDASGSCHRRIVREIGARVRLPHHVIRVNLAHPAFVLVDVNNRSKAVRLRQTLLKTVPKMSIGRDACHT